MEQTKIPASLEHFERGMTVDAKIVRVTAYTAFAAVDGGVAAVVPARELVWNGEVEHTNDVVSVGENVRCLVTKVDTGRNRLVLSLRRVTRDPWSSVEENYGVGQIVSGRVVNVAAPGYFVEVEDGLEALLPKSDIRGFSGTLLIDDHVEALIADLSSGRRVMHLSIRQHLVRRQGALSAAMTGSSGRLLGEYLGAQWAEAERRLGRGQQDGGAAGPLTRTETSRSVLVIDDDKDVSASVSDLLSELGHRVQRASSAKALLHGNGQDRWDLILMDVGMKGVDGIEAARAVLQRDPDANIALVTGLDIRELLPRTEGLRLAALLQKPPDPRELQDLISRSRRGCRISAGPQASQAVAGTVAFGQRRAVGPPWEEHTETQAIRSAMECLAAHAQAEVVALFDVNATTLEVSTRQEISAQGDIFRGSNDDLRFSPIVDVVRDSAEILETSVRVDVRRHAAYEYLLPFIPFNSCLAVPVKVFDVPQCALFAFHRAEGCFAEGHLTTARASAMAIGSAIETRVAWGMTRADQRLATVGLLTSGLAHELRNDLTVLASSVHSLDLRTRRLTQHPDEIEQTLTKLRENVSKIGRARDGIQSVASKFLALTAEGDKPARVAVNKCVGRAVDAVEPEATKLSMSVKQHLEPDLPSIETSAVSLEHILINLLANAVHLIREHPVRLGMIEASTYFDEADEKLPVKIAIRDTGPGIHGRDLANIFNPLVTSREGGTGLGLYICRQLAESIGARVRVLTSYMFVGTTFLVELPMALDDSSA